MNSFIENYQNDALASFRNYKKLAERAIEQVSDDEFFSVIDEDSNSVAVIAKHIAGNLHSRCEIFSPATAKNRIGTVMLSSR